MMTSNEIRESFLSYFQQRDHKRVESSSLIPAEDPTLLFTNAGMVQFKSVFTGQEKRDYMRAASAQRCLRAGGKHNDLENVGTSTRHHTFFEMLGNFSFGDYFKEEAILHAHTLLFKEWGLDPSRIVYTVFDGNETVAPDKEARALWKKIAGVDDRKILGLGMADNFWAMGDTGPCGPCSEIHYLLGEDIACRREKEAGVCLGPACDCDRWTEIWNLVFMQYERSVDGTLALLPKPSIDTGMGLERITAILQGKRSNYDTDLFQKLIHSAEHLLGGQYERPECPAPGSEPANAGASDSIASQISLRVVADHFRASAFLIADGIYPSNEGRGYVLRRIMRRMTRHARLLGAKRPVLHNMTTTLVDLMASAYPVLAVRSKIIQEAIEREEEAFLATLDRGMSLLNDEIARFGTVPTHAGMSSPSTTDRHISGAADAGIIAGGVVFKLYDTFGFPPDLTELIARDHGLLIDHSGFEIEMSEQRERSRKSSSFAAEHLLEAVELDLRMPTEFSGYDGLESDSEVIAIIPEPEAGGLRIVLDRTPFYAESGGQIGDRGALKFGDQGPADCQAVFIVEQTVKNARGVYFHIGKMAEPRAGEAIQTYDQGSEPLRVGSRVRAIVDHDARMATERHHTATHLLHAALRKVLGEHVAQAGSYVGPDRLRFDFSHFKAMTPEEITKVEHIANDAVVADVEVRKKVYPIDEARKLGAMAFFGEKYGDMVRVVSVEGYRDYDAEAARECPAPSWAGTLPVLFTASREFCGGTHVRRSGEIGLIKIVSETAVAAGIRRLEATTGDVALTAVERQERILAEACERIAAQPSELGNRIARLLEERKKLQKELARSRTDLALTRAPEIIGNAEHIDGVTVAAAFLENMDKTTLRTVADKLLKSIGSGVIILGSDPADDEGNLKARKAALCVVVSTDLTTRIKAGEIVGPLARICGGGGGGKPTLAEAGGRNGAKVPDAIKAAPEVVRNLLERADGEKNEK